MALELILKNVCCFLELLQSARNSNNLNWNTGSFQNAFQWAEYCEKIYHQSKGKPYEVQLDKEITKLSHLPWTLGDLKVDLKLLKYSTGLLALALVQNESVGSNDSKLRIILDKSSDNEYLRKNLENFITMNNTIKELNSIDINDKVEMSSKTDVLQNNGHQKYQLENLQLETAASLLIGYLKKIVSNSLYDNTIQRMFVRDKLQHLTTSKSGSIIVIKAYLMLFNSPKWKESKSIWEHFHSFVASRIKKSDIAFWVNLPKDVVLQLCSTNEKFVQKLFHILTELSKDFSVYYNESIFNPSSGRLSLFEWRYKASEGRKAHVEVNYNWLKDWVNTFLRGADNEALLQSVTEVVSNLANESEVNIWKTICQDLARIDLLGF